MLPLFVPSVRETSVVIIAAPSQLCVMQFCCILLLVPMERHIFTEPEGGASMCVCAETEVSGSARVTQEQGVQTRGFAEHLMNLDELCNCSLVLAVVLL